YFLLLSRHRDHTDLHSFPTRRSSDLVALKSQGEHLVLAPGGTREALRPFWKRQHVDFGRRRGYLRLARAHDMPIIPVVASGVDRSEEHTSELQSRRDLVCRLLLEKKK